MRPVIDQAFADERHQASRTGIRLTPNAAATPSPGSATRRHLPVEDARPQLHQVIHLCELPSGFPASRESSTDRRRGQAIRTSRRSYTLTPPGYRHGSVTGQELLGATAPAIAGHHGVIPRRR